ncbi:MAG: MBL fold metallo-hydrolase [Phycisphaerales bacterium]|nr:MBL fold metallo-hydrolase [Phycisphaerales bacterium]
MRIKLLGASGGEVTGSAYLLQTDRANVMIDCGLFQGSQRVENYNRLPTRERLGELDAVVLTHAHLDHTGRLPLLTRFGYSGPIYATPATIELTDLVLRDAAHLQVEDVRRQNRRRAEQGKELLEPLYTVSQVQQLKSLFRKMRYDHATTVADGIQVRAVESGHILGSASLEVTVEEGGKKKKVVFSGDIGPRGAPLHRDPMPFNGADAVFMESTYGGRDHPSLQETAIAAREAIGETVERGGRVLVPVFAIGRTQLLLYLLAGAFKRGTLKPFPIFVDSPMAIEASHVYKRHMELFDEEAAGMVRSGDLSRHLRTMKPLAKATESRALAKRSGPFLVMAGAGMCMGGRILHHMSNHLPDPTTLLMMVGYQSRGSIGRRIVDGAESVRIYGKTVPVRARTHIFSGLSGHAGQKDLMAWIGTLASSKPRVYLTHGEEEARATLGGLIRSQYGLKPQMPKYLETIEL